MPDFNIKPKIADKIKSIGETNMGRVNAAMNSILGKPFIGEENVFDIFNEVESLRENSEYGYSEQKSIGQKPVLTYTGEGLKKYSFNITLHHAYCRPDYIIQELKAKAALGEAFSYYQEQKYVGEYVITSIETDTIDKYKNVTLCAKLSVEILESIQELEDEDYEQQTKTQVEIPEDNIKDVSSVVQQTPIDVVKSTAASIFDTLTENAIDMALRNAESYINSTIGGVTGGIL